MESGKRVDAPFAEPGLVQRRALQVVAQFGLVLVTLFGAAGTLRWRWGWIYMATFAAFILFNALVLPREIVEERARAKPNVKEWDRSLMRAAALLSLILFVVIGLDYRMGWTPAFSVAWQLLALLLTLTAGLTFTWAIRSNRFFSTAVRIQAERGHTVATGGPYRYVRHPGYAALIVSNLSTPILLSSLWGLLPAAAIVCLYVVRTAREDATLHAELPGYAEFSQRTRYRLAPGLW